jgi:hypothetical protein
MGKTVIPPSSSNPPQTESTPPISVFIRLYWMLAGHLAIGVTGVMILSNNFQPAILLHGIYFFAAIMCIVTRYIDIRFFKGLTGEYEPATMAHWRRYSLIVAAYAIPLWTIAFLVARSRLP